MTFMTRAFSAEASWSIVPGALPQATDESAPLAQRNLCRASVSDAFWTEFDVERWTFKSLLSQRLIEVLDQVVRVFEADGQAQ